MSGKCDSIHSSSKTALTQNDWKSALWNNKPGLDIMHLIGNNTTKN
jgi:hypothetical protein